MILPRALRYLVLTRWKNRVLSLLRKLKTPTGIFGLLLLLGVAAALIFGIRVGEGADLEDRLNTAVAVLGFFLVTSVLSGIGQRGFVFLAADLDYLFPTPIARRHMLLYHFVPHYLFALFMALFLGLILGGRSLPQPGLFLLGIALCQITSSHLSALAAEISMALGDRLYGRLRNVSTVLLVVCTIGGMLLLIGSLTGAGNVSGRLRVGLDSPLAQVVFFPAVQAVTMAGHAEAGARLAALGLLSACALGSFFLVLALRVDFVEASFNATKKAWKQVDQMRRGVGKARVKRSAGGPRGRWFRGAGAVLWLNLLTMRRQLRSMLGGVLVVTVMLAVFGGQRGGPSLALAILLMLGMVPLWMPLPVGFRLPREQLLILRELPAPPARLACALLAVPALVPFLLQLVAVAALTILGRIDATLALAVLPVYAVSGLTLVGVESLFVLMRPHPNAINLVHQVAQLALQFAALLPGLIAAGLVRLSGGSLPMLLLVAAAVQAGGVYAIARFLGAKLQFGRIATA